MQGIYKHHGKENGSYHLGFPKHRFPFWRLPIIRITAFGLYIGVPLLGEITIYQWRLFKWELKSKLGDVHRYTVPYMRD